MSNNPLKILSLSIFLILALAACGGQASQPGPAAAQPEAQVSPSTGLSQPEAPASASPEASQVAADPASAAAAEVGFAADVLPVFEQNCTRCHGSSRQNGGLRLDSYSALMAGGKDGAAVVPGNAEGSLLIELISSGEMPRNAAPLPETEITLIREWIDAGAPDN